MCSLVFDGFIFSPSFFSPVSFGFGAAPSTISVTNSCHCLFPKVFCKYRHNPLGSFFVNDASSGGSKSCCGPGDVHVFLWEKFRKDDKNYRSCLMCFLAWAGGCFSLLCLCLKSGGFGCFMVLFWICSAHESGFTGTQQIHCPKPSRFPSLHCDAGRVFY